MARRRKGRSWAPAVADLGARRRAFEELVARALDNLPEEFRSKLDNVEVVIEDDAGRLAPLGLYQGIPQTERGQDYSGVLPDVITIYRWPIERRARSAEELEREVRTTVIHEVAHHFGISDERLRELGYD